MANKHKESVQEIEDKVVSLTAELSKLQEIIVAISQNSQNIFKGASSSAKEVKSAIEKVNAATEKLNETNKKTVVVNGQIKGYEKEIKAFEKLQAEKEKLKKASDASELKSEKKKQSEMNAMWSKRKKAVKEESDLELKKARDYKKAQAEIISAAKKANSERLKEADSIERNKKALQRQKNAMIEASREYNKLIKAQKVAKKALQDANLEFGKNSKEALKSKKIYDQLTKKVRDANTTLEQLAKEERDLANEITKANKARVRESDTIESNRKALQDFKAKTIEASRPYQVLISQHKKAKKALEDATVAYGKNNVKTKQAQKNYDVLSKKVNQANAATRNFAKGGLRNSVNGIRNLLGAFGLIGGVQLFSDAISSAFKLTTALDSIGFAMKAVITDAEEFAQTQTWLKQITKDFGAELITTTNRYIKFRAASQQAGFSAKETQKIFGTMTKAAGVLGLKTDELTGIYLALEQMISKGKITTEELRRQLGERLPGAMDIMATSMGVTTAELDKMLKAGQVLTKDVLGKFADQVEISFGLDKVNKVKTLRAAITRLKNSWTILVDDFAKGGTQIQSLTALIDHFARNFKTYVNVIISAGKAFLWYKGMVLAANIQTKILSATSTLSAMRMQILGKATVLTTKKVVLFNRALKANVIGIIITALYAAYEAFNYFNKPLGEATKLMKEQTEELKGQTTAYIENRDEVNKMAKAYENLVEKGLERTNEETAEMDRLFIALAKSAPIIVTDVDKFGNATKIATDKLKNFNKEQGKVLLFDIRDNIKEQKELIKDYVEEIDTAEDVIFRARENRDEKTEVFWIKKKQLLEQEKRSVENQIETNEDLIGSITGVLTVRQKEAEALKATKDGRKAYEEHTRKQEEAIKKSTLAIDIYNKKLKELQDELKRIEKGGITFGELERYEQVKKEIESTKNAITSLNKETKGGGKTTIKYLKGTLSYYESLISKAKQNLKTQSKTKEEYNNQLKVINNLERKLKDLKKSLGINEKVEEVNELNIIDPKKQEKNAKEVLAVFRKFAKGINDEDKPEVLNFEFSDETKEKLKKYKEDLTKEILRGQKIDLFQSIFKDVTDTFSDMFDIDVSKFDFIFDSLKDKTDKLFSGENIGKWADLSKELIGSVLDASMNRYDIELQTAQRNRDLILNNDLATEEAKENARKKFDEKERQINIKKAKQERENNLIKIAMDTAVAVTKTFAELGFLAGLPFAGAMIAIGATQAAIVASQPLPQFEKGTDNAPEGWAITQEKRPEPIVDKYGNLKTMGSSSGDALTYLNKGDRVFKNRGDFFKEFNMDNIQNVVFEMNMQGIGNALNEKSVDNSLLREISSLKTSNEKIWGEVKKLASRPIKNNVKVEIKEEKAY